MLLPVDLLIDEGLWSDEPRRVALQKRFGARTKKRKAGPMGNRESRGEFEDYIGDFG